jgi:tetraacyldisaccharide 4'-kinase
MKKSHQFWARAWYGQSSWAYCLLPLSCLLALIARLRKWALVRFVQQQVSVPVVVIGNISVGGTGKTPLIIALVQYLQQQGYRPGVVSRGYGGKAPVYPYLLDSQSTAAMSGDEPLLIYQGTRCEVCVAPDRLAAARRLVDSGCDIILSDDGLQHYKLGRAMEIAVIDGQRSFGNGFLLPAGPLREPVSRLKKVDMVVVNNPPKRPLHLGVQEHFSMHIQARAWRQLSSGREVALGDMEFKTQIHALAGIGNPERFFRTLDDLGLCYYAHAFDDHHDFQASDFAGFNHDAVVMTEKDAVKCAAFAQPEWYALLVGAELTTHFWQVFQNKLAAIKGH